MSKEVVVVVRDDLDGSVGATPVAFGWKGRDFEIDLNEEHAAEFEEAIRPYLQRARAQPATPPAKTRTPRSAAAARRAALTRVRAWALEQGYQLPNKARVPYQIHRAYNNAHPDDQVPLADEGQGTATTKATEG